jgi:uncharacterized Ntn-hydrolase superfamily protein
MSAVTESGRRVLRLISNGADTEDALERATGRDGEGIARTLAALKRRGLIERRFSRGCMRYEVKEPAR